MATAGTSTRNGRRSAGPAKKMTPVAKKKTRKTVRQGVPKARGPTAARREARREGRRRRVKDKDEDETDQENGEEDELDSDDEEDVDAGAPPGSGGKARATVAMKERERALKMASLARAQQSLNLRKQSPADNENRVNDGVKVRGVAMTPPIRALPPVGTKGVTLSSGRVLSPKFLDMCDRIAKFQDDFGPNGLSTLQEGTVKDYAQMLAQKGMVETTDTLAERVQAVGRDKVFENVKFCTALNANLFQYKGCVMRTVCEALNISGRNVDVLQWNEMFKNVRKGMANRRNSVRTSLRLEVQAFYNSRSYKEVSALAPDIRRRDGLEIKWSLMSAIKRCFEPEDQCLVGMNLPEGRLTDESCRELVTYAVKHLYPLCREWWLKVALRCGSRRKVWVPGVERGEHVSSSLLKVSCEAYLLVTLDNNNDSWYAEFATGMNPKDENFPQARYTGRKGRKSCCGYKGWSVEGIQSFNKYHDDVERWRAGPIRKEKETELSKELKKDQEDIMRKEAEKRREIRNQKMVNDCRPRDTYENMWQANNDNDGEESFWNTAI